MIPYRYVRVRMYRYETADFTLYRYRTYGTYRTSPVSATIITKQCTGCTVRTERWYVRTVRWYVLYSTMHHTGEKFVGGCVRHEPEMTRESRTKQEVHAHRSLPTKKAIMMLPFSACKLFTIVSFITSLSYGSSFTFLHSASWRLAQFSLPTFLPHTQKSVRRTTSTNSSENDSEEPKLILGDQIK